MALFSTDNIGICSKRYENVCNSISRIETRGRISEKAVKGRWNRMKIKDMDTGHIFEYGSNRHHALRISEDGRCLYFEHLQNGDGSIGGGYRFVDEDTEQIPKDIKSEYGADSYFNIGGFRK